MKNVIKLFSLFLVISMVGITIACEKIEKNTPPAIKKLIRGNNWCLVQVNEYEYDNKKIYCFLYGVGCSGTSAIYYDKKGKKFWEIGKEIGSTLPEDFEGEAILKRTIWMTENWYD